MTDIIFKPNTWLENAGIVGLTRVLDDDKSQYKIVNTTDNIGGTSSELHIDNSVLNNLNFTNQYFQYFINTYSKYYKYQQILDEKPTLQEIVEKDYANCNLERLKGLTQSIKNILTKSSVKQTADYLGDKARIAVYTKNMTMLNQRITKLKKLKPTDDNYKSELKFIVDYLLDVINYLSTNKINKYYQSRLLSYNIIPNAWNQRSIMDSANLKHSEPDLFKNFDNVFVKSVQNYLQEDHSQAEYRCANCHRKINYIKQSKKCKQPDGVSITFLNDMGYYFGHKLSNAWNLQDDLYICPICQLMYACIPCGFMYDLHNNGLFINLSNKITFLKKINDDVRTRLITNLNSDMNRNMTPEQELISSFQNEFINSNIDLLANAQIISLHDNNYDIQNIPTVASKTLFKATHPIIKQGTMQGKNILQALFNARIYQKRNHKIVPIYIYNKIIQQLLNNTRLDDWIYKMEYQQNLQNKDMYYSISSIMSLIKLNSILLNELHITKGNKMAIDETELSKVRSYGRKIKNDYARKANPKKAQSLAYKMLEALYRNDIDDFMHLLLVSYTYLDGIVPNVFVNNQNNVDAMKEYGHAFIAGLIEPTQTTKD